MTPPAGVCLFGVPCVTCHLPLFLFQAAIVDKKTKARRSGDLFLSWVTHSQQNSAHTLTKSPAPSSTAPAKPRPSTARDIRRGTTRLTLHPLLSEVLSKTAPRVGLYDQAAIPNKSELPGLSLALPPSSNLLSLNQFEYLC